MRRVTVVLDDDPTGTQEVSAVPVLLRRDREALQRLLTSNDAVFILTNTRAMPEADAVSLLRGLYEDIRSVEDELGVSALVVQRGDSTMRGHVFAEIEAAGEGTVAVFAPAFPAGGRRTTDGVHSVRVDGEWRNAADTEFAADPVFGYTARTQSDYVREKGDGWTPLAVTVAGFATALAGATPGTVLLPDAETDDDIRALAADLEAEAAQGTRIVVRSAAPLAAYLAGAKSTGFLSADGAAALAAPRNGGLLVVVGSHTAASGAQLAALLDERGITAHELDTDAALTDPAEAGAHLAELALADLRSGLAVISTERTRRAEHSGLEQADAVMSGLVAATRLLAPSARAVVAKGGITSAEIARSGLGRNVATVAGQLVAGVSLWVFGGDINGRGELYAVVPGNIGDATTLRHVVALVEAASA